MKKLTAIIPVGNEVHNIEDVIRSVSFADEVLVVDSYGTDGTYEKAKKLATRVVRREFDDYSSQKNWAIPQAKHEWILLVDADERITPELEAEITEVLKNPSQDDVVAYWIGRKNHFMGRCVRYSGRQNDKVIRLFMRDECRYDGKLVHEEIITDGKVGRLNNRLHHNTYVSLDQFTGKLNHYACLQAKEYDKKTGTLTPWHFLVKPFWGFFKHYVIQGGFRDGVVGLTISYLQSYAVFMRYIRLWQLRQRPERIWQEVKKRQGKRESSFSPQSVLSPAADT